VQCEAIDACAAPPVEGRKRFFISGDYAP